MSINKLISHQYKFLAGMTLGLAFLFASCEKLLNVDDSNSVELSNHYNNFNDADNAIKGIYGKLMKLVDRIIVLNELRGDLMDIVPGNATPDQIELNNHNAAPDNYYCDTAPFFEVILNCNDVLANFEKMRIENKLNTKNFEYRYAEVVSVRCWVYLQMAIHFGKLPYLEKPLVTVDDLKNQTLYPELEYEEILSRLAQSMRALPESSLDVEMAAPLFAASASTTDNINLKMLLLNKHFVFGDVLLYNHDYWDAAAQYLKVITDAEAKGWTGIGATTLYKARYNSDFSASDSYFYIAYLRNQQNSIDAYGNRWNEIFILPSTDRNLASEMINMIEYKARFAPQYPLVELFGYTGKGKYQLKPSKYAIEDLWEPQMQQNGSIQFDGRGRQSAFDFVDGNPVVIKYLYDYHPKTNNGLVTRLNFSEFEPNENNVNGKWFIYRTGLLHLRYAEAANRAGFPDLADALLQRGVRDKYNWSGRGNDVEGIQYSGYPPGPYPEHSVPYPYPFYLDARSNTGYNQYQYFNESWSAAGSIRRRAYVRAISVPEELRPLSHNDSIIWMEKLLLQEAALECGFEGYRWGDLLRIAHRKNKEDGQGAGTELLNELIGNKFEKEGRTPPDLTTTDKWFLKRK